NGGLLVFSASLTFLFFGNGRISPGRFRWRDSSPAPPFAGALWIVGRILLRHLRVHLPTPLPQPAFESPRQRWHRTRQIIRLAQIFAQIVKLDFSGIKKFNRFVVPDTNSSRWPAMVIMRIMPKERLALHLRTRIPQRRNEAAPVLDLVPRPDDPRRFQKC